MPVDLKKGAPTTRRYTKDEKAQADRLARQLRKETGEDRGACIRVANQLGFGPESVRRWVMQADVDDGFKPGQTSDDAVRIKELESKVKELERANQILRQASAFFATELDRPQK